jgi:hypothetical protein
MHDNHEPDCSLCTKFVLPFDGDGPLSDWGYCAEEMKGREPTPEELKEIEEQVKKGDHSFLSNGRLPLYQALGEGCDRYEEAHHHH